MVKTVLLKKCSLRRYLKNCQPVGKFMCVIKIFLCVTKVIPIMIHKYNYPQIKIINFLSTKVRTDISKPRIVHFSHAYTD